MICRPQDLDDRQITIGSSKGKTFHRTYLRNSIKLCWKSPVRLDRFVCNSQRFAQPRTVWGEVR